MPRAIWSGSISFGLVSIPVRMFSAIDEKDLHFHLLHVKDDSRIGYEKVCKEEGKPVPDDEIGKAYEISKGSYVYLTDEDFEAAAGNGYKVIDIEDFVPYEEIDPIYFERTYFLGPGTGGEKAYAVLARAMEDAGLAAIATYVMREKQQLGCLRIREGVLTLEKMYFADEVRPIAEIEVESASVGKRELEMASELIDRFRGRFDITKYRDDYREALLDVVKAKKKGREVHVEPREVAETPDLIAALRESVAQARGRKGGGRRAPSGNGSLAGLSKRDLEQRARREGVRGYSKMTKDELIEALRSAA
jgi:DNA end-binding protein Ku